MATTFIDYKEDKGFYIAEISVHADVPSVCSKTNYNGKLKQCNPTKAKLGGVIFL